MHKRIFCQKNMNIYKLLQQINNRFRRRQKKTSE